MDKWQITCSVESHILADAARPPKRLNQHSCIGRLAPHLLHPMQLTHSLRLRAADSGVRPNQPANQIRGLQIQSRVNAAVFSPMIERRACVLTKVFN
jgi:hypothetical protein